MGKPNRFHIANLPANITKDELTTFLLQQSNKIESVTVDSIGKRGKNKAFALVSIQGVVYQHHRLSYQGQTLTIQKAGGFGASSWAKPKVPKQGEGAVRNQSASQSPPCSTSQQPQDEIDPQQQAQNEANNNAPFTVTKSLDALLADYGDHDPNWQKVVVSTTSPTNDEPNESCLGMRGKAPIHVVCSTFGMMHGIPNDRYDAYYDCRAYEECPQHLQFLDGQTAAVKRILVNADSRQVAYDMAKEMETLLKESMENGFGYANPCQLRIMFASDTGRHRSVVVAELAAVALRKILRKGEGFACPVSVGCFHRDIQKRRNTDSKKQDDAEDEKEIKARRLSQRAVRW